MNRSYELTILAILLVAVSADLTSDIGAQEAASKDIRAVFTHVSEGVTLTIPQEDDGIRIARDYQVIPSGATITVPPGGTAEVVCSTDRQILLDETSRWELTSESCARGRVLQPGTYLRIAPRGGRLRSAGALIVVEHNSRGVEDRHIPVLLSPRKTSILEGRPTLRWTAISAASEYQVELLGRAGSFIERFRANEIDCAPDPDGWGETSVCALPYPPEQPELEPGQAYFLTVGARKRPTSSFSKLQYGEQLRRSSSEQIADIDKTVVEVQALQLTESARWVMLAGIYSDQKLFDDAIAAYRQALALAPAPELWISLGDIYLRIDLPELAESCYRKAGDANGDPGVEAAVAFGLGRVHHIRHRNEEAVAAFLNAQASYEQLELIEEAELAARQATRARSWIRR